MSTKKKNPAAVALGKRRAKGADMSAVAKLGGEAARGKSGRKRSTDRCACALYTKHTAKARGHKCAPKESV